MSYDILREEVPPFRRRPGDMVISGPNNSAVILGRDRVTVRESGYGDRPGAGAVYIVAGRASADQSVADDRASVYISARNDPDDTVGDTAGGSEEGVSVVIARGDCIRISGRTDVKVTVGSAWMMLRSDGTVVIDGNIQLGEGASLRLLTEAFAQWALAHTHPDPTSGFTGPPVQPVPDPSYTSVSRGR